MTPKTPRFSELSPARQALVRILQAVNLGEIKGVRVRNADPTFDDSCFLVIDAKLDQEQVPRPELDRADFELRAEVGRPMSWLDEMNNGTIQRLEAHAGIPRGLAFESRLLEAPGAQAGVRYQVCHSRRGDSASS
jgi:hypothetical protein